ncbi:MAG: hypothetical protein P8Y03_29845 [Anaerolineales bacterium]
MTPPRTPLIFIHGLEGTNHGLHKTVHAIDWPKLLVREANR